MRRLGAAQPAGARWADAPLALRRAWYAAAALWTVSFLLLLVLDFSPVMCAVAIGVGLVIGGLPLLTNVGGAADWHANYMLQRRDGRYRPAASRLIGGFISAGGVFWVTASLISALG